MVFSGSAIVKDDALWLMYTGHIVNEDTVSPEHGILDRWYYFEKIENSATADGLPEEVMQRFRDPKILRKMVLLSVVQLSTRTMLVFVFSLSQPDRMEI